MELATDIAVNLISDTLFAAILVAVAWLLYVSTDRRRLMKFFSISNSRSIHIYLSNIEVIRGGSIGADGAPRSFFGSTVVLAELECAERFRALFNPLVPLASGDASLLGRVLLSDIQVIIAPSPSRNSMLTRSSPIISFGSQGYNTVSAEIEHLDRSLVKFVEDNSAIKVANLTTLRGHDLGFVTRIYDPKSQSTYFQVAGGATIGTQGAATYLASHWRQLHKKFGADRDFVVVLKFDAPDKFMVIHESERV